MTRFALATSRRAFKRTPTRISLQTTQGGDGVSTSVTGDKRVHVSSGLDALKRHRQLGARASRLVLMLLSRTPLEQSNRDVRRVCQINIHRSSIRHCYRFSHARRDGRIRTVVTGADPGGGV